MKFLLAVLALVVAETVPLAEGESADVGYRQESVHAMPFGGVVTFRRVGDDYFFMKAADGTGVWRVQVADKRTMEGVEKGSMLVVESGETRSTSTTRRVLRAKLREWNEADGASVSVPDYRPVKLKDIYRHPINTPAAEDLWGELVACEGIVRDVNRRQQFTQIQIGEGDLSFQATVRVSINTPLPDGLKLGARVLVRGIMLYTPVDDSLRHVMTDFTDVSVMPVGPDDVVVVSRAPFWTPGRVWSVTVVVLCVALLVTLWATVLRQKLFESMRRRIRDEVAFETTHRERLRLSSDLHDDFQQLLAGTMFRIGAAQNRLEENDVKGASEFLKKATDSLNYTQTQLRTVLWGLNEESEGPASLVGLFHYASERMAHWKNIVSIKSSGREPKLARFVSGSLLMVLQEAVGNALTHGFATKVDVNVEFAGNALTMIIHDNGVGFDAGKQFAAGHYGIQSMHERLAHIGGTLKIESTPECGTTLTAWVPLGLKKETVK